MAGNPDRIAGDLGMEQVRQVDLLARIALEGKIQHLIEIAVVDVAPPIDRDEVPAHHVREIGVEMRAAPYGVSTEAEARKAVQEIAKKKPDLIKIWVDDRGGTVPKLPPNLYRAIIDELMLSLSR